MSLRLAAGLLAAAAAASTGAQTTDASAKWLENVERRFPSSKKNAAAADLERLALSLGIDARPSDSEADHPSADDLDAYRQAGFGSWLEAQVKMSDGSIASPPPRMGAYLLANQPFLLRVVGLLLREIPDWGFDARVDRKDHWDLAFVQALNKVLLSAALIEERAGRHREAGDLTEAAWSSSRSLADRPDLVSQLVLLSVEKLQIGVVRKLDQPPLAWNERTSALPPWRRFVDALENDPLIVRARRGESAISPAIPGWHRVWEAVRERTPCEASKLSPDEVWQPLKEELARSGKGNEEPTFAMPNLVYALHRAARLAVDRELTEKVLELRMEKAASRSVNWPEKFFDLESRVCPSASYAYRLQGADMGIRFVGSIATPDAPALSLPLSFEARPPKATATPTRTPRPARSPASRP